MIKASYDPRLNAVICDFSDEITPEQVKQLVLDIQKIIPKHQTGFKVLTDLSGIQTMDPAILEPVKKLMDYLNRQGVKEVVRVIADPAQDIGLNIMSPFHYSKEVQFRTFQSRKEAQASL